MIKFILYLLRWQLSTPIMAPVIAYFTHSDSIFGSPNEWFATSMANLIGGCIFFWVDRFIFSSKTVEQWEIIKSGKCYDCGEKGVVRRLVLAPSGYNRVKDPAPEYRCAKCSRKKLRQLKKRKDI